MSSNIIRITGMSSGLDVDALVDALVTTEKNRVDNAKKEQQKLEWKQEAYREIIKDINDFKNKYLNYVNSSTNMLSPSTYSSYDINSSDTYNRYVKVSGNGIATTGVYNISNITVAKRASYTGGKMDISSTSEKVSSLFSSEEIENKDAVVKFTINDVEFSYDFSKDKDKTISSLMNEISNKANVNIKYSQLTGKFTIQSTSTGYNTTLKVSEESGKLITKLFGTSKIECRGSDASVKITDPSGESETITKPTNTFTIDGVTYSLISDNHTEEGITVTISDNVDDVYEKISDFINDYNTLISKINDKITEKADSDYQPLTDDEKDELEDDEIKKWEEKAKKGIIRSDSTLQTLLTNLRSAFYTSVDAAGIKLTDIGLSTSSDYTKNGKIEIDADKLKSALKNNKEAVVTLFTNVSTTQPSYNPSASSDIQKARRQEEGIFQRISDFILDNVRTTRNDAGYKGTLLEKAGLVGDLSETKNTLSKQIAQIKSKIKTLQEALEDKEDYYYLKYSKLEAAMSTLNSQSSYLSYLSGLK